MHSVIEFFIILALLTECVKRTPDARAEPLANPQSGGVTSNGDTEVLKDRAALLDPTWDFPFSSGPFPKSLSRLPGAVGVSLGLGLPAFPPSQTQYARTTLPAQPSSGRVLRVPGRRPECAKEENFCLHTQLYPLDKVNAIVDQYYNEVRHMYADLYQYSDRDLVHHDNRTYSTRQNGHFVCESSVQYLRLGWAQNIHGDWLTVINTEKFPQSVRVETCRHKDGRCEYLPPCYKSKCVQRYNFVKLLCLDPYTPANRPTLDVIQVPAGCSCFVEDFTYY